MYLTSQCAFIRKSALPVSCKRKKDKYAPKIVYHFLMLVHWEGVLVYVEGMFYCMYLIKMAFLQGKMNMEGTPENDSLILEKP